MILGVNVDFIKLFVVSLERLFLKISNFNSCIKFQCIQVISRLKYNIEIFDHSVSDSQIPNILNDNNIEEHTSYKRKLFDVKNIIQSNLKSNSSIPKLCLQTKQNTQNMYDSTTLSNAHKTHLDLLRSNHTFNSGSFDPDLSKSSTQLSNGEENLPNKITKPGRYCNFFNCYSS